MKSFFLSTVFILSAFLSFSTQAQNQPSTGAYEGSGIIYGPPVYTAPDYGNNNNEINNNERIAPEPVYPNNTVIIRETVPVPIYVQPQYPYNNYPSYNQPYPYGQKEPRDNTTRDNSRRIGGPLNPTRSNPTFAPNPQPDASNSNGQSFQDRRIRGPNFNERLDKRLN